MVAPLSSYSVLVIQLDSKVDREERIDPPIQAAYFLSGEAINLTSSFIDSGTKALISFVNLSGNSLNIEVPPAKTIPL